MEEATIAGSLNERQASVGRLDRQIRRTRGGEIWKILVTATILWLPPAMAQLTYDDNLSSSGVVISNWTDNFLPATYRSGSSGPDVPSAVITGYRRYNLTIPSGFDKPNILLTVEVHAPQEIRNRTALDCDILESGPVSPAPFPLPLAGAWSTGTVTSAKRIQLYISSNDGAYIALNSSREFAFTCAVSSTCIQAPEFNFTLVARALPSNQTLVASERTALLKFMASCCPTSFSVAACHEWRSLQAEGKDFCSFPGQSCLPSGNLMRLDLSFYDLNCEWPGTFLSEFNQLSHLLLSGNPRLKGSTTDVLTTVASLPTLQYLDFRYDTGIVGALDIEQAQKSLCKATQGNLTVLRFANMRLRGTIPQCLLASRLIRTLDLGGNSFTGSISNSIPSGSQLETLALGANRLSGSLPSSMVNASSIYHLDAEKNNLEGTLPAGISSVGKISLSTNRLTGAIPDDLGLSESLYAFNVSLNNFTALPVAWNTASTIAIKQLIIDIIDVSHNKISGPFPSALAGALNLTHLDLSQNNLTGPLPGAAGMFPTLETFRAASNSLTGSIPEQFGQTWLFSKSPSLDWNDAARARVFDLSNNKLNGSLPSFLAVANAPNWTHVRLQGNPGLERSCGNSSFGNIGGICSSPDGSGPSSDFPLLPSTGQGSAEYTLDTQSPAAPEPSNTSTVAPLPGISTGQLSKTSLSGGALAALVIGPAVGAALLTLLIVSIAWRWGMCKPSSKSPPCCTSLLAPWRGKLETNEGSGEIDKGSVSKSEWEVAKGSTQAKNMSTARSSVASGLSWIEGDDLTGIQNGSRRGPDATGTPVYNQHVQLSKGTTTDGLKAPSATPEATNSRLPALSSDEQPQDDWQLTAESVFLEEGSDGRPQKLGSGAFGAVYKGTIDGLTPVAVKTFHSTPSRREELDFLKEVTLLKSCRHCNIVQFYGACTSNRHIMLVTELMEAGDLWTALREDKDSGVFSWYRRGRHVAMDVAQGLHYLHSRNIVHFDLKSPNVLLTRDLTAKISDVGLARMLIATCVSSSNRAAGTFQWAAPELLLCARGEQVTEKVDIYSYGVLMWEVVTRERPVRGQLRFCRTPEECPQEVEDLIGRCLSVEPEARPDCREIIQILKGIPTC